MPQEVRTFLRALAVGFALAGCNTVGVGVPMSERGGGEGTLTARALRSPISPVEGLPGTGGTAPAAGVTFTLTRLDAAGSEQVVTDRNGEFRKTLSAGSWRLDLAERPALGGSKDLPRTLAIEPGRETHVDIRIDTGIR
jgi:hypothetical protein